MAISDFDSSVAMRNDPATVRFRGIAAILARGVTRVRRASDLLADKPTVSANLADSLPKPLEIAREPSLSVSRDVSDHSGRQPVAYQTKSGDTN